MATIPQNAASLGWAIQSAQGTPATNPTHRVILSGGDLVRDVPDIQPVQEMHGFEIAQDVDVMSVEGRGAPQFICRPSMAASLVYGILGHKSVSGGSDPYTWTIDSIGGQPLFFTVWANDGLGALVAKFTDVRMGSLHLHGQTSQYVQATPTFLGGVPSGLTADNTAVAFETADRFRHSDGAAALLLENVALRTTRSWDLNIGRGVAVTPGDGFTPIGTTVGELLVTLAMTYLPADMDIVKRLLFGTATLAGGDAPTSTALVLTADTPALQYSFSRSANRLLRFLIPRPQLASIADNLATAAGPRTRTLNIRAYDPGSGVAPITFTIKNGDAAIS